jgi:hypothetical protein
MQIAASAKRAAKGNRVARLPRHRRNLLIRPSFSPRKRAAYWCTNCEGRHMNGLIYLIGLIVVIMAVLSILGLR